MKLVRSVNPTTPHGNVNLWRYMSLEKFLTLVIEKRITFANAEKLTDKYEITLPLKTKEKLKQKLSAEQLDKLIEEIKRLRSETFVSCWTKKRQESYLLWKIYLHGAPTGVAIKTTASKLHRSIEQNNRNRQIEFHMVEVEYSDFIPVDKVNELSIASTKTKFYEGEDEVRLFFRQKPNLEEEAIEALAGGIGVKEVSVEPASFIDAIYISPFGSDWFRPTLRRLIRSIDSSLVRKIRDSEVLDR